MVPWMSEYDQCSEPIQRRPQHNQLREWLVHMYKYSKTGFHYQSDSCQLPCTKISIHSIFQDSRTRKSGPNKINLYFAENIPVEKTVLAYGFVSLLVEIGSSLGLWLGLSVVGMFDVSVLAVHCLNKLKEEIISNILAQQSVNS